MSQNSPSITRSRTWLILALALSVPGSVLAQSGTVAPVPRQQFLDNNGNPLASGKLYTYAAGTSTPLETCTNAANPCLVPNTNPIILDSAGRATIFLTTASYKFVLATSLDVVIWTVDNVSSVAPFNVDLDVTGTAGETLAAGEAVYLSSGAGGRTAGRWYKTDADLVYASTGATELGIAAAAIASGSAGSIRQAGRVTGLTSLSVGSDYFLSATAGAITVTPPTNAVRIGRADSSSTLVLGNFSAPAGPRGPPCGRLTLTTNVPVTATDVTAATTVFYTPYGGCNQLSLFDGLTWNPYAFSQISIAVPASTNQMYDVFAYDNAGVVALELTAWTNDTTRATALAVQNGVYVKTGALTRLYLGSFRTTGVSGQTEDSLTKRLLFNYYNRVLRPMARQDTTVSWTYSTATWRQANASTGNQLALVTGVPEEAVRITLSCSNSNDDAAAGRYAAIAIALDSTTTPTATGTITLLSSPLANALKLLHAELTQMAPLGYHFYAWLEFASGTGTDTFYGGTGNQANLLTTVVRM